MSVLTDSFSLNNSTKIPQIGFGTWQIPDGDAAYRAVTAALQAGYRHIDTAYAYQNEQSVGRAIKDSGIPRADIFVTSKLPAEVKDAQQVAQYLEETRTNLGLDYLDLYLIHAPWPWRQIGTNHDAENVAVWQEMIKLQAAGKIRTIGVSNFNVHDLTNLLDHTNVVPAVDQIQYYVGFTEPNITTFAHEHGILIEAYSPLATGSLLNNDAMATFAKKYGVSVPQLALRFVLQNRVLPLPKASSTAHIKANAQLNFSISADDMATLNEMADTAPSHFHNPTQG